MAHPNSAMPGGRTAGRFGMARENVPNPVSESSPVKMRAPTPEASSPGSSTAVASEPPMLDASSRRNAPANGVPSSVLIAAKLPVAR